MISDMKPKSNLGISPWWRHGAVITIMVGLTVTFPLSMGQL